MNTSTTTNTTAAHHVAEFRIGPDAVDDGIGAIVILEHARGAALRYEVIATGGDSFGKFAHLTDAFQCAAKVVADLAEEFTDFWADCDAL